MGWSAQKWTAPTPHTPDDAGVSYNTSTTLTAISPGGAANPIWIPGGTLEGGDWVEIDAYGTVATSATTPNFTFGIYYGGTAGVVIAATTATAMPNTATVNWPWRLHYDGRVLQAGTSGTIIGTGTVEIPTSLTAFTPRRIPETAMASVTIDTTINKALVIGGTWGTSAAANIAFCHGLRVRSG